MIAFRSPSSRPNDPGRALIARSGPSPDRRPPSANGRRCGDEKVRFRGSSQGSPQGRGSAPYRRAREAYQGPGGEAGERDEGASWAAASRRCRGDGRDGVCWVWQFEAEEVRREAKKAAWYRSVHRGGVHSLLGSWTDRERQPLVRGRRKGSADRDKVKGEETSKRCCLLAPLSTPLEGDMFAVSREDRVPSRGPGDVRCARWKIAMT